jgi:hypothetical protein
LKPPLGEKGDHCVICFKVDYNYDKIRYGDLYNYYKANYDSMLDDLNYINWDDILNQKSTDEAWGEFLNVLKELIEKHIPVRKNKIRKSQPWLNMEVRQTIKAKNKAWKEYKKNMSIENWNIFKRVRNEANRLVYKSKCDFELKIASEININPKQFWSYVKSKNKKLNNFPNMYDTNGVVITADKEKANCFNRYFASVYTKENIDEIPHLEVRNEESYLDSIVITPAIVELQLQKLNTSKAAGPDNLHAKVLFELRTQICKPLSVIFNKSISEGKIPKDWKFANIKPIFKKGDKKQVSNYRPVSLTSICCKIMERLIRNHMIDFLETNKFLSNDQHGFRSGRSCTTQLLETLELWTNFIDNGMSVDCIYLDFAKAFDKVPHVKLVHKLKAYGFCGNLLKWLEDFLTNRQQRVVINNTQSKTELVTSGIPQGSVLGPTLFIIFINDLPEVCKSYVKIFADDTKIFNAIKSSDDATILQEDINKLVDWSEKWQLPFNMSKSKILHYGRNNPENEYLIGETVIEKGVNEKDLGVLFDNTLKFTSHIAAITRKANSRLGMIKKNFANMRKEIILPLYKSLVRPILEYCSCVWNPALRYNILELEKVQRRATKLISNISHLSYEERLKSLRLDSLAIRRRRNDMLQVYRIIHGIDNINASDFFEFSSDSITRGHRYKINKPRVITSQRQNTFSIRIVNDWNSLNNDTVSSESINIFKTRLAGEWDNHPERYMEE